MSGRARPLLNLVFIVQSTFYMRSLPDIYEVFITCKKIKLSDILCFIL